MNWIFRAPGGAAILHLFEEFVFPGGFTEWYRGYAPALRASITGRWLAFLNGMLLLACAGVAQAGTALAALVLGASYPVWSMMMHKARSRRPA